MIIIDIYSFVKALEGADSGIGFARLKKELSELEHHHIDLEHIHSSAFFSESSMHVDNDSMMRLSFLQNETSIMHDITKNLNILASNIDILKTMRDIGQRGENINFVNNILSNEEYGINPSIESMQKIGSVLDEMEGIKDRISKKAPIDIMSSIEHEFSQKHGKLRKIHGKQKQVLLGLSRIFLELAKGKIKGDNLE